MSRIVALDTETTGLDPATEDVFEIAAIDLDTDREYLWRLEPRPWIVARMHPKAAEVNRYHERTSSPDWRWDDLDVAADEMREFLEGAHIVGAVPDFDTRHLTALYQRTRLVAPRWHYHLIDVEAMAVGWLHGLAWDASTNTQRQVAIDLPWKSDDLSRWCGVEPPSEDERHTALGDARWVARWYRALTGGAS